jgi:AraC-like DNA-binding protein
LARLRHWRQVATRRSTSCVCAEIVPARVVGHHGGSKYVDRVFLTEAVMTAAVPHGRYLKIVRQIVKIARTRIAERPLQISEFSRLLSIEPRAITRAFRAVHDCSPHVYLRNQRLIRARNELLLAREGATVKQIAAQFGFTQFGRFSVEYKTLFGESPSVSLARAKLYRTRKRKIPAETLPSSRKKIRRQLTDKIKKRKFAARPLSN